MRKLLNTLFVVSEDAYLTLDGENIVVQKQESKPSRYPLHTLESVLYFGYKGASPALMGACAQKDVSLCFFTPRGRFLCRSTGEVRGNVLLRQMQFRYADMPQQACAIARSFLAGK
ncbi:MAG: CRISPR-associated endonuclease Cas1, partial [Eubacteriales bacterium]|nr:CRISPR-associated endonuclease Cas1 [Eubacteriales bacterium]